MQNKTTRESNLEEVHRTAPSTPSNWGVPIFSWLAIGNYSPLEDHWWVRDVDLPFEIVLMPGYRRPKSLVTHDIDSIWYEGEISEPLVIWDGEFSYNLFEMISMSLDPAGEMIDFIKVREKSTGKYLEDPRPREMLQSRPQRKYAGDMISYHREIERSNYVESDIPHYYEEWRKKTSGWCISGEFSACYNWMDEGSFRLAPMHWKMLAKRHPDVDDRRLLSYTPTKVQVVPGVKFGARLFQKELEKHPKWIEEQLQLEYYTEIGADFLATPYQRASFKQTRNIPLTEEDAKILNKGGDHLSPEARGFVNKFFKSLRGK